MRQRSEFWRVQHAARGCRAKRAALSATSPLQLGQLRSQRGSLLRGNYPGAVVLRGGGEGRRRREERALLRRAAWGGCQRVAEASPSICEAASTALPSCKTQTRITRGSELENVSAIAEGGVRSSAAAARPATTAALALRVNCCASGSTLLELCAFLTLIEEGALLPEAKHLAGRRGFCVASGNGDNRRGVGEAR